ncbi:MAG: DUF2127 domain-containing protein [Paraburkholderia sp.]|nr:MAG: DUF2127 domain-containing protein [Paraburkholderia sp.]
MRESLPALTGSLVNLGHLHMNNNTKANLREIFFRGSVSLKGLDAALEIVGGAALLAVSPTFIVRVIAVLTQNELAEDPRDLVANYALAATKHLSIGTEHFMAYYLFSHGVIKLALVLALLQRRLWAYTAHTGI